MLDFIVKYWLQVLLGLVSGGLGFACKYFWKLYKSEKNHQKTKEQKEFYDGLKDLIREGTEESRKADEAIREEIQTIKTGVLSVQRRTFINQCKELLKKEHEITTDEYLAIQEEHSIYHNLGGNHDGDEIYELVMAKGKVDVANAS